MNGVDCFDQLCSTNATYRREKQTNMSLFTYILDIATRNAYQVYLKLCNLRKIGKEEQGMNLAQFKHQIVRSLMCTMLEVV